MSNIAGCVNYGCDTLGSHIATTNCLEATKGGSSTWVIFDCNATTTDFSNATQINADIAAGRAAVVTNIKSGFGKPSPITIESLSSCGVPQVIMNDWTGTIMDGNISSQNISFWNAFIAGRKAAAILMYECSDPGDTAYATAINPVGGIAFSGGRVIPNVNTQPQLIELDFKWKQLKSPQQYAAPVGVTGV